MTASRKSQAKAKEIITASRKSTPDIVGPFNIYCQQARKMDEKIVITR